MKSEHIDNQRLYAAVNESLILEEDEVNHLGKCEECLELVRVLIRQSQSKSADAC
jgi:hypothetical protein